MPHFQHWLVLSLGLAAGMMSNPVFAQPTKARVLSVVPVIQEFMVPRHICSDAPTLHDAHRPYTPAMRHCTTQTVREERTVGYEVTYEHAGRRHTTRMDHDPGSSVTVQTPVKGHYGTQSSAAVPGTGIYDSTRAGQAGVNSIYYEAAPLDIPLVIDLNLGNASSRPGLKPPRPPYPMSDHRPAAPAR